MCEMGRMLLFLLLHRAVVWGRCHQCVLWKLSRDSRMVPAVVPHDYGYILCRQVLWSTQPGGGLE